MKEKGRKTVIKCLGEFVIRSHVAQTSFASKCSTLFSFSFILFSCSEHVETVHKWNKIKTKENLMNKC